MAVPTLENESSKPPFILRMYFWFVIAVTAFEVCRVASLGELSFTVQYTGWMIAFPYMFSIFFVFAALRGGKLGTAIKSVRGFLVFAIVMGVIDFVFFYGREDHNNPYLRVSLWRPLFTVAIPGVWLILLSSKSVTDYCLGEVKTSTSRGIP